MSDHEHNHTGHQPSYTRIFARKFPIIGWVPIGFYIPDCTSKYDLRRLIEKHGGIVVKYEAFCYQIKPQKECNDLKKFYTGNIYSSKWIKACIKRGKFIEDNESYCLGFNRNPALKTITKKRTAYTIIEVLKMFDMANKVIDYSSRSVKFWDEVEKKNIIPDRTSQSLRTAWRKFSKYGEEQFIKEALKDQKIRFSHQFESVPFLKSQPKVVAQPPPKPQISVSVHSEEGEAKEEVEEIEQREIDQRQIHEEIEEPLDMEVCSREASEEAAQQEEDDNCEFLLAIEDLQSALAFNATDDRTYSLNAPKRRKDKTLSELYDDAENISIGDYEATKINSPDGSNDDSTRFNSKCSGENVDYMNSNISITRNRISNEFTVKKVAVQKSKQQFFEDLSKELRSLSKEYGKEMDEMHMLFMEVSCDLGELKSLLKGMKAPKWSMLEDLAIQSEPDSAEFKHICNSKGESHVLKRRKFLELHG
ncbi:unnamed protein product [Moneuplotes crassus]|uniref:BRCT domain-containing protein n=1 Tax=Euplotes crassus TaxID=5936 RepID=A0AAD1UBW7_EUPCR|nr:unnamed protein product [Moneuplotes crassus]